VCGREEGATYEVDGPLAVLHAHVVQEAKDLRVLHRVLQRLCAGYASSRTSGRVLEGHDSPQVLAETLGPLARATCTLPGSKADEDATTSLSAACMTWWLPLTSVAGDIRKDSCARISTKVIDPAGVSAHLLREEVEVEHLRDDRELDHAPADLAVDAVRNLGHRLALPDRRSVELDGEVAEAAQLRRSAVVDERRKRGRHPRIHGARTAGHGLNAGDRVCAKELCET
jgi:hypothetical protein